ncbi:hypothetical protein C440_15074 [Haloferax mucosum ATCC BAA-1512]|uniref:Uncharacterized protein n=2 Tax=Haloferax mucosum TaxID=403181 RepID=M0I6K8_9EURY|nr:hypothetical protein C440_15074 [Haloferax mucosum ATCC BAA-1512]
MVIGGLLVASAAPAAAASADSKKDDITCEYNPGYTTAVIDFSDASNTELWNDARAFAKASLEKCGLDGREETELAGEVRAHALGEHAPGDLNPGQTIDMAGSGHDPQEDKYGWLMGDVPGWIPIPGDPSTS